MAVNWMTLAYAMRDELSARRRDFHEHPELSFEEVRTAGIVAQELGKLGLEVTTGVGKTGVVGVLDGTRDGPTVMVRCDMDALPVAEANHTDYISQTPGKMHACGHDGHTAIGLAVAKMLTEHRDQIAGRVKFIFQPAEEIGLGAAAMIDDGALENPKPDVCVGLHLFNDMPVGNIGLTPGPMMASSDNWTITIKGKGGHGAVPEQTYDPIIAGTQIVSALQTIVSRNVSAFDTAVVSVTTFHAGDTFNIIPPSAQLTGTFRTYKPEICTFIGERMREIAAGIAAALQCEADVLIEPMTQPVMNDPAVTARLHEAFSQINGARPLNLLDNVRWMAGEDVALFQERVPGTYIFVGSANQARELNFPHHHPRFDFDEEALPIGAGLLATAVAAYVMVQ